jgi:hypothetical protein
MTLRVVPPDARTAFDRTGGQTADFLGEEAWFDTPVGDLITYTDGTTVIYPEGANSSVELTPEQVEELRRSLLRCQVAGQDARRRTRGEYIPKVIRSGDGYALTYRGQTNPLRRVKARRARVCLGCKATSLDVWIARIDDFRSPNDREAALCAQCVERLATDPLSLRVVKDAPSSPSPPKASPPERRCVDCKVVIPHEGQVVLNNWCARCARRHERRQHLTFEVIHERERQDKRFGPADARGYALGTGQPGDAEALTAARARYAALDAHGAITWRAVIDEELCEVFAESDPVRVRAEAIQAAAALLAMVEAIDGAGSRRKGGA